MSPPKLIPELIDVVNLLMMNSSGIENKTEDNERIAPKRAQKLAMSSDSAIIRTCIVKSFSELTFPS